jgi:DNA-binding CsgD family transcriptional regulator
MQRQPVRQEERFTRRLLQGETVVRAAERLGVSHNTVRTHLQRIFQKTGASHQADLVRLILLSIPGVSGALR